MSNLIAYGYSAVNVAGNSLSKTESTSNLSQRRNGTLRLSKSSVKFKVGLKTRATTGSDYNHRKITKKKMKNVPILKSVWCSVFILMAAIFGTLVDSANAKNTTGCQGEFLGKCKCGKVPYNGLVKYVTNCTNSGFQNASVLEQLSLETEVLIFTGNNISTLPPNLFGEDANYDELEVIDLSNNNITKIQGKAFHHVSKVKKLILNDNRWLVDDHRRLFANMESLEELHLDAAMDIAAPPYIDSSETELYLRSILTLMQFFKENPMPNLRVLNLASNGIGPVLNLDLFCPLPSVSSISLANNSILEVDWNSSCPHTLQHLNLSYNHIRNLRNDTLHNFDVFPDLKLDLSGNDFDCNCLLKDFVNWLHDTDVLVVDKESYACKDGLPEENAGKVILSLETTRFWCPTWLVYRAGIGIAHVVLIIIVCLMVLLLTVVAVMNRRVISLTARRWGEPVYRRLQYSSIQKLMTEREMEM